MVEEIHGKTMIFIEESALLEKGFIPFAEELFNLPNFGEVNFFADGSLKEPQRGAAIGNAGANGWLLDGSLDVLNGTGRLFFVDTKSYFDFDGLFDELEAGKFDSCRVMTQKENVFEAFEGARGKRKRKDVKAVRFVVGKLEEWQAQKKDARAAFFVEKEKNTNAIDAEGAEYVFSPKYRYLKLLRDNVREGGEGKIYKTYQGMLCKVLHPKHITYINIKKLQAMLKMDVFNAHVNWPQDIIYYDNNPVGYVMDEITGVEDLDNIRITGFKGFSETDRYDAALNFLEVLYYLHEKGIVVGDLKPDNILIRRPSEVFLIDCGSYQVADYPCIVFHPQYTKKKYTEQELRTVLRSPKDDYYAINKIVFEILVGQTPHYNPNKPIEEQDPNEFAYPIEDTRIRNAQNDKKRADFQRWAFMSGKMREMFFYYFTQNKVSYLPEWITEIKNRMAEIENETASAAAK
ncbi:MAG: serine/threonine-protein kinase [Clostridiales bacterium]|jgi:hypothetical protein|nr:serine/threonine-protein kinase [Clostridiales bacterium]